MQIVAVTLSGRNETTPSQMNAATTLFACEILGTAAFNKGIKSAPCLDKDFLALLVGFEVGNPMTIPMMDAWIKGWHGANLAKATQG